MGQGYQESCWNDQPLQYCHRLYEGTLGMKLTGTMRDGRHLLRNVGNSAANSFGNIAGTPTVWWKKALRILAIISGVLIVLTVGVFAFIKSVGPPPVKPDPRPANQATTNINQTVPPVKTPDTTPTDKVADEKGTTRDETKYTFLILGMDEGGGNTDVIMVVRFDALTYEMNVVSIPRDTMVNVKWSTKKINSVLANQRREFKGQDDESYNKAMQGTVETFADVLGFEVDYWFTVNMKAFVTLVTAIGGIDYYVPSNMEYHDPEQNLHISYKKGMHKGLTGQQALEILRYRSYPNGDIGRINNRQSFLKTAAEQILAKKNTLNVMELAEIFIKHVKTDLKFDHLVWLGKELLKMDAENISFVTMPGNAQDSVNSLSYVSIYVDEWLEIVNTLLNPFSDEITATDVSILTRGADRKLYVTDGNRLGDASWGASSKGPAPSSGNSSSGNGSNTPKNPAGSTPKNPSSSSSNSQSSTQPAITDNNTNAPSTNTSEGTPDSDHVTNESPSDEIAPLDIDPEQTENPDDPPAQTITSPDTSTPPETPPITSEYD